MSLDICKIHVSTTTKFPHTAPFSQSSSIGNHLCAPPKMPHEWKYIACCLWLLLLSQMHLRGLHDVVCTNISLFYIAEQYGFVVYFKPFTG